MPRTYSEAFLIELHKAKPTRSGTALALVCVEANLPAKYVAEALDVTRMTVFSWFRGKSIRHKNLLKVEEFMETVAADTAAGLLPARSTAAAKKYIQEMMNKEI